MISERFTQESLEIQRMKSTLTHTTTTDELRTLLELQYTDKAFFLGELIGKGKQKHVFEIPNGSVLLIYRDPKVPIAYVQNEIDKLDQMNQVMDEVNHQMKSIISSNISTPRWQRLIQDNQEEERNLMRINMNYTDYLGYCAEKIHGENLSNILKSDQQIEDEQQIDWALQIMIGLVSAHAFGVLHGDFKSENIMVDSTNNLHFIDPYHSKSKNHPGASMYHHLPEMYLQVSKWKDFDINSKNIAKKLLYSIPEYLAIIEESKSNNENLSTFAARADEFAGFLTIFEIVSDHEFYTNEFLPYHKNKLDYDDFLEQRLQLVKNHTLRKILRLGLAKEPTQRIKMKSVIENYCRVDISTVILLAKGNHYIQKRGIDSRKHTEARNQI